MKKRVIITTGGTGGHIFPAQGLADQLIERYPNIEILFVGGALSTNRYFDRNRPYKQIDCSSLSHPLAPFRIGKGIYQSFQIMRSFQPDVVVGFGSYYTFPPLAAAKLLRVPIVLHVADSIPGKVNRVFAPFVAEIGVNFPHTIPLVKGKATEVGMPLRGGFRKGSVSRNEALAYFNLRSDLATILIFGGSQGAAAINKCLQQCPYLEGFQLIHFTGSEATVQDIAQNYKSRGIPACVKAFEGQMAKAWAAADLFIGRAGASTISEALEFEVPGILIPYPSAAENHQEKNADYLVNTVGGAVKLLEANLNPQTLAHAIKMLSSQEALRSKREAMQAYKKRALQVSLCDLVLNQFRAN